MLLYLGRGKFNKQTTYLLDSISGATVAYGLRLLRKAYSGRPLIRVRRSSDNTEVDIGHTKSGDLDTNAISAFAGVGNAYATLWYDQMGTYDMPQATAGSQLHIYTSGNMLMINTRPTLYSNNDSCFIMPHTLNISQPNTISVVGKFDSYTVGCALLDGSSTTRQIIQVNASFQYNINANNDVTDGVYAYTNPWAYAAVVNGATSIGYLGGVQKMTGNAGTTRFQDEYVNSGKPLSTRSTNGRVSEVIVYSSVLTPAQITTIASNQNAYYSM